MPASSRNIKSDRLSFAVNSYAIFRWKVNMISSESSLGEPRRSFHLVRAIEEIQDALQGLRYGSVNVIVQDGIVVQIDRMEKRRLNNPGAESSNT